MFEYMVIGWLVLVLIDCFEDIVSTIFYAGLALLIFGTIGYVALFLIGLLI